MKRVHRLGSSGPVAGSAGEYSRMPRRTAIPPDLASVPFSVREAREAGVGRRRLQGPDLARPFHGVRGSVGSESLQEICAAYARIMDADEFFSHLTAARLWGMPLPTAFAASEAIHVSRRGDVPRARAQGVVGHRLFDARVTVVEREELRIADPVSAWLHLAPWLSEPDLVAAGDFLVRIPAFAEQAESRPYATIEALAERARLYRGRGARSSRGAASRVREGADSRAESLLRLTLVDHGLPEPALAVTIIDSRGRFLARADMAYPEWRVIVEYDGDQHRTSTQQYERDVSRIESLAAEGWFVVRVRAHGLFRNPASSARRVASALRRAGYTPATRSTGHKSP
jgi:very-short-patch-repair endonuclease